VLPHSAFCGQTPDEMYFGPGDAVGVDLTFIENALADRIAVSPIGLLLPRARSLGHPALHRDLRCAGNELQPAAARERLSAGAVSGLLNQPW
jgi:hypothetical protein